jgi:hypothetical protein
MNVKAVKKIAELQISPEDKAPTLELMTRMVHQLTSFIVSYQDQMLAQ